MLKMPDYEYPHTRRFLYEGACFVPVCERCGRYVRPDPTIKCNEHGLHPGSNATCSKCGRTRMPFEGFGLSDDREEHAGRKETHP